MVDTPEKIESEFKKEQPFASLTAKLDKFLKAEAELTKAGIAVDYLPGVKGVVSNMQELESYNQARDQMDKTHERLRMAHDTINATRQDLLDALPARNVSFNLKIGNKNYLVRKELNLSEKEILIIQSEH